MLVKRLSPIGATLLLLLLLGSATIAFGQNIGNNNFFVTNSNNGQTSCGLGGITMRVQASADYNEYASTGASGYYSYQLQIRTPTIFPSTGGTIGFQQTMGVANNVAVNAGVTELPSYQNQNAKPGIPPGINPGLTTTDSEFYQEYNSNQVVTGFGWYITYYVNGNLESYPGSLNVNSSYFSTPNEFQMVIVGVPGQTGGYADFLAGKGVISYYGGPGFDNNPHCPTNEGLITTENSNILYNDTLFCLNSYYCTQTYSALPWQLSLSSSPTADPLIGQSVTLTATANQGLPATANSTFEIIDESTGNPVAICTSGSQCSRTLGEDTAMFQDYQAFIKGYGGYNIATSNEVKVTWSGNPSLTVNSQNQGGQTITGYYTVLEQNGNQIGSGYTPVTLSNLGYNQEYTVYVDNYGSCTFNHWADNGNTNRERTFTITESTTFTAVYDCSSTGSVTVNTVNQNGQSITEYYVGLYNSGGTLINHGFSPVTFSGLSVGTTYSVEPDNYGSCSFNHWQDTGSSVRDRSFTAASSQTFTAVYECT